MRNSREDIAKFIKFAITGVLNTAVDAAIFTVLINFGANVYLAQTAGYTCGMLNSYLINRSWTFKSEEKLISLAALRFAAVNLCLLVLSFGVIYISQDILGLSHLITKLLTLCCTMGIGFIANRLLVFRTDSKK